MWALTPAQGLPHPQTEPCLGPSLALASPANELGTGLPSPLSSADPAYSPPQGSTEHSPEATTVDAFSC